MSNFSDIIINQKFSPPTLATKIELLRISINDAVYHELAIPREASMLIAMRLEESLMEKTK